jgi:Mg2+/citrate symporter
MQDPGYDSFLGMIALIKITGHIELWFNIGDPRKVAGLINGAIINIIPQIYCIITQQHFFELKKLNRNGMILGETTVVLSVAILFFAALLDAGI